jgi:hypothetical protein
MVIVRRSSADKAFKVSLSCHKQTYACSKYWHESFEMSVFDLVISTEPIFHTSMFNWHKKQSIQNPVWSVWSYDRCLISKLGIRTYCLCHFVNCFWYTRLPLTVEHAAVKKLVQSASVLITRDHYRHFKWFTPILAMKMSCKIMVPKLPTVHRLSDCNCSANSPKHSNYGDRSSSCLR